MKYVKNFKEYLYEGRGINNAVKEYVEDIINIFLDGRYEFSFDIENPKLPLMNMYITFEEANYYYAVYNDTYAEYDAADKKLYNCGIEIKYPKNYNIIKLKELLAHELNHINECYNYFKKIDEIQIKVYDSSNIHGIVMRPSWTTILKIKNNLSDINKKYKSETFNKFIFNLYLSLDNEMNARVCQIYPFLKSFETDNKATLLSNLYTHQIWKYYLDLSSWDSTKFLAELSKELSNTDIIKITEFFNTKLNESGIKKRVKLLNNIPEKINSISDVNRFYSIWEDTFHIKADTHKAKLVKMVDEVIRDYNRIDEGYKVGILSPDRPKSFYIVSNRIDEPNIKGLGLFASDFKYARENVKQLKGGFPHIENFTVFSKYNVLVDRNYNPSDSLETTIKYLEQYLPDTNFNSFESIRKVLSKTYDGIEYNNGYLIFKRKNISVSNDYVEY